MRGALIQVFLAEVVRLDRSAMSAPRLGTGTSALDDDFREPRAIDDDDDGIGERVRIELPPVRIPCQIEPEEIDDLRSFAAGSSPRHEVRLVFHFRDLERLGLVDRATGEALLFPGDRLGAIFDRDGGLVEAYPMPAGMFLTERRASGFGLDLRRPRRNLLLVRFEERQQATGRPIS
jgi:hypothetical protein